MQIQCSTRLPNNITLVKRDNLHQSFRSHTTINKIMPIMPLQQEWTGTQTTLFSWLINTSFSLKHLITNLSDLKRKKLYNERGHEISHHLLNTHSQVWGNFWPLKALYKWWKMLWKLFSFSSYLNYCLGFLVIWKKDLIRKIRSISKFMTSQPGQQTIEIRVLSKYLQK